MTEERWVFIMQSVVIPKKPLKIILWEHFMIEKYCRRHFVRFLAEHHTRIVFATFGTPCMVAMFPEIHL